MDILSCTATITITLTPPPNESIEQKQMKKYNKTKNETCNPLHFYSI